MPARHARRAAAVVIAAGRALCTMVAGCFAGAGLGTVITLSRQSPTAPEGCTSRANASGLAASRIRHRTVRCIRLPLGPTPAGIGGTL